MYVFSNPCEGIDVWWKASVNMNLLIRHAFRHPSATFKEKLAIMYSIRHLIGHPIRHSSAIYPPSIRHLIGHPIRHSSVILSERSLICVMERACMLTSS
jgi:hypothetical protein